MEKDKIILVEMESSQTPSSGKNEIVDSAHSDISLFFFSTLNDYMDGLPLDDRLITGKNHNHNRA